MKVLKGGTLIDGTGAGPVAGATVVVLDQRIEAVLGKLRRAGGVIVGARADDPTGIDIGLQVGDVIHEVNGDSIADVEGLLSAIARVAQGNPVAILLERAGRLLYVAFEME